MPVRNTGWIAALAAIACLTVLARTVAQDGPATPPTGERDARQGTLESDLKPASEGREAGRGALESDFEPGSQGRDAGPGALESDIEPAPQPPRYDDELRDEIDASAPTDPKAVRRLQQAETLIAAGRWERAQEVLLFTLEHANGAMVRRRDGRLAPVEDEANALLGEMPTDALELYRRRFGAAAERAFSEAIASGRHELIERVATHFRHTDAGSAAIRRLAAIHFDRGEFALAARRYEEIPPRELDAASRMRAASSAVAVGNRDAAQQILVSLTQDDRAALPAGLDLERILEMAATDLAGSQRVGDWLLRQGDPTGSAIAEAGSPVLLRRWSHPLTHQSIVQGQIVRLSQDLRDDGRATIPASVPLAVGDVVAARTFGGIAVYDQRDGRLLWETREQGSPEELFARGEPAELESREAIRFRFQQFGPDPSGTAGDHRPLTSLFYRDGIFGSLSSDGRRVFVIENHSPVAPSDFAVREDRGGAVAAYSNRLASYDLATGRPAWPDYGSLGGLAEGGPFEPPLAGSFFFGPPTPDDGELYVVTEKEKEIRLLALDSETGALRWERVIAHALAGIDQDPARRAWAAQVSVSGGVLVCPTTVGWLVGVDRSSRSILWAHRFAPPQPRGEGAEGGPAAVHTQLNARWCPAAPIVHRGRVLYTPSEEARLVCLDLATGDLVWQRGKGAGLYVAGVVEGLAVVVGSGSVEAVDLATGAIRWTLPIPDDAGRPSGRAALTASRVFLPVRDDTLWEIDVAQGKLVSESHLPAGEPALGNLVMHRGTLLSYSPSGIAAFEERGSLSRQVTAQLARREPAARLREAELLHAEGDTARAAQILKEIDATGLPVKALDDFRRIRWNVLSALARLDSEDSPGHLRELAELAVTPEQRLTVRRLEADQASAIGRTATAVSAYLSLLAEGNHSVLEEDGRRKVRLDAWVAGRLQDLRSTDDPAVRSAVDGAMIAWFEESGPTDRPDSLLTAFAALQGAAALLLEAASSDLEAGRFAQAQIRLLNVVEHGGPSGAATALLALADASRERGLPDDAGYWLTRARAFDEALGIPGGGTLGEEIARRSMVLPAAPRKARAWGDFRLAVVRSGSYTWMDPSIGLSPDSARLPFFRDHRMRLLAQQERMSVSGAGGAGLDSVIPLRTGDRAAQRVVSIADAHVLFLLRQGMVQAISPPTGTVLWSAPAPDDETIGFTADSSPAPMRPAGGLAGTSGLLSRARQRGQLPAASASYVALRGRGELTVLDATNGETRWTRDDLPRGAVIVGTPNVLYVLPKEGNRRMALRALDGCKVPLGQAGKWLPHAVAMVGDRLLTVVADEFRLFELPLGRRSVVALRDPLTGETAWSRTYPSDALFDLSSDERLRVLTPDGELAEIDPESGNPMTLGKIPAEVLRGRSEAYLLADADAVYLAVNAGRGPSFFAAEMPAVPVGGHVFAFARQGGELLWRREVASRRLLCQEFDHLPVLLFTENERVEKGNQGLWRVNLLALDKRSGEPVLDEPFFTASTPFFRGLSVDPERRTIELGAYNTRLRLQAVPVPSARSGAVPAVRSGD